MQCPGLKGPPSWSTLPVFLSSKRRCRFSIQHVTLNFFSSYDRVCFVLHVFWLYLLFLFIACKKASVPPSFPCVLLLFALEYLIRCSPLPTLIHLLQTLSVCDNASGPWRAQAPVSWSCRTPSYCEWVRWWPGLAWGVVWASALGCPFPWVRPFSPSCLIASLTREKTLP